MRLFILPIWICNYRGGIRIQFAQYYLMCTPIQNYIEIHPQIWQTEHAEEHTLCGSCAVSPFCDTHTHTHTHTYTHQTRGTAVTRPQYAVRIIQLFAIPILCLSSSKALPGTQSGDQQITERSDNIPEIYWTDWRKQQLTVRLEFEFHKKSADHDLR